MNEVISIDEVRQACKESLHFLCTRFLGFKDWDKIHDDIEKFLNRKSRKKLILVVVAVLAILAVAGAGAAVVLNKRAAAAEAAEEAGDAAPGRAADAVDRAHPPTFVPLDAFVVNLADKDADRYAQIGVTLEIDDAKFADKIKLYMPAIRNGVLMVLADKTSRDLLDRSGKEALAAEILRAAVKPLGLTVDEPAAAPAKAQAKAADGEAEAEGDEPSSAARPKAKVAKAKAPTEHNPVRRVHFSNFIIQ